jgi:hypothetical protein
MTRAKVGTAIRVLGSPIAKSFRNAVAEIASGMAFPAIASPYSDARLRCLCYLTDKDEAKAKTGLDSVVCNQRA